MDLQSDLARLSTRGRQVVIDESNGELIYLAPDAVIEAIQNVIGDVRHR